MPEPSFPSMGATLFFGLTVVALLGHSPTDDPINPMETHKETQFQHDRSNVDFAQFVAWSVPLGFVDLDPNGREGALVRPVAAPAPNPDVQFGRQHAPFPVQTALVEPGPAPVSPALDAVLSRPDEEASNTGLAALPDPAQDLQPSAIPQQSARISVPDFEPDQPPLVVTVSAPTPNRIRDARPVQTPTARVAFLAPDTTLVEPRIPFAARVTGDQVHLRARPDRGGLSLGKFDVDTPGVVLEQIGDWALVVIDQQITGWMFAAFLEARSDD